MYRPRCKLTYCTIWLFFYENDVTLSSKLKTYVFFKILNIADVVELLKNYKDKSDYTNPR